MIVEMHVRSAVCPQANPARNGERRRQLSELLTRIGEAQDVPAYQQLFAQVAPRVKTYMMRFGVDADAAEDLTQETMALVWRKAHLYSPAKGAPTTWIYTIARNLRTDRIRREHVWQELPDDHDEIASDELQQDDALSVFQLQALVRQAMTHLPAEQLEVISLSYVDGLSQSEISEKLVIPVGTVKSRMRMAYAKLQAKLEELR